MKIRHILVFTLLLSACSDEKPTATDRLRTDVDYHSAELEQLNNRISDLEKANKYAFQARQRDEAEQEQARQEADRLDKMHSDQRVTQQSQKLLCDATGGC